MIDTSSLESSLEFDSALTGFSGGGQGRVFIREDMEKGDEYEEEDMMEEDEEEYTSEEEEEDDYVPGLMSAARDISNINYSSISDLNISSSSRGGGGGPPVSSSPDSSRINFSFAESPAATASRRRLH
eukprot:Nk52_evm18s2635 gene=Nk52_evmTU18s2635